MDERLDSEHSPHLEAGLEVLFSAPMPDAAFVARLERHLVARKTSDTSNVRARLRTRGTPLSGRRRWAMVALALLLVLVVTVVAIGPQRVWASLQRLLGYVPGLGFVNLEQAWMLAEPVEVSREGVTLRVEHLIASSDRTVVQFRTIAGISGFLYPQTPRAMWDYPDFEAFLRLPDGSRLGMIAQTLRVGGGTLAFPPLPANAEIGEVTLELSRLPLLPDSAAPENWEVPLPLQSVTEEVVKDLGVQVYALSEASDSHAGITLRVLEVAHGPEETSIHVQVEWDPAIGQVTLSAPSVSTGYLGPIELHDSHIYYSAQDLYGWSPVDIRNPAVLLGQPTPTAYEDMWTFAPLFHSPPSLTLQVDWFEVIVPTTEVSLTVDLGDDPQDGDRWPLDQHLTVDGFPVHVTGMRLERIPAGESREWWGPWEYDVWRLIFEIALTMERERGDRVLESVWLGPAMERDHILALGWGAEGSRWSRAPGEGWRLEDADEPLRSWVILKDLPKGPVSVRVGGVERIGGPWTVTWAIPQEAGAGE